MVTGWDAYFMDLEAEQERRRQHVATIYDEIQAERKHQDEQWGGPAHDDHYHTPYDWEELLQARVAKAGMGIVRGDYRRRLIQVAALAVAAIEQYDRKHPRA